MASRSNTFFQSGAKSSVLARSTALFAASDILTPGSGSNRNASSTYSQLPQPVASRFADLDVADNPSSREHQQPLRVEKNGHPTPTGSDIAALTFYEPRARPKKSALPIWPPFNAISRPSKRASFE